MRRGKSFFKLLMTAAGLFLSCVLVQAKGVSMPKAPITIEGLMPVKFNHVLHRSYDIPCGQCHHDNKHKMRTVEEILGVADAKELDCKSCHNKNLSNPYLQSLEHLFHTTCQPCHAVGINGVRGPRKCEGCHIYMKK